MSYIKLEPTHVDDERWLAAGAEALAVHVAALSYCDRQLTDGRISRSMALRVSLAVHPASAAAAVDALVEQGFWTESGASYQIERYLEHAFPAEQVKRTRDRWATDKARRRQHDVGDHSLCKDPKYCAAIRVDSTSPSTVESRGGRSHLDQTRPDQTGGLGSGSTGTASADAPRAAAEDYSVVRKLPQRHEFDGGRCCNLPDYHPVHDVVAGVVIA